MDLTGPKLCAKKVCSKSMYDTYVAYSIYNSNLIHTKIKEKKSRLILQYHLLFVDTPLRWIERRIIALICVSDEVLVLTIPTVFN